MSPLKVLRGHNEVPLEPSLLTNPALSVCTGEVLQPSHQYVWSYVLWSIKLRGEEERLTAKNEAKEVVEYLSLLLSCDQPASPYQGIKSTRHCFSFANGTIPLGNQLQSVCGCYMLSLCKRATMRRLQHQRFSNPGTLLCCSTSDENRAKRRGSPEQLWRLRTHTGTSTQTKFSSDLWF